MVLGKIVEGVLHYAPRKIVIDGMQIHNPTVEQLKKAGYKEVIDTAMPEEPAPDGQHYEPHYEDKGKQIEMVWELVDDAVIPPPQPTIEERVTDMEKEVKMHTDCILEMSELVYK